MHTHMGMLVIMPSVHHNVAVSQEYNQIYVDSIILIFFQYFTCDLYCSLQLVMDFVGIASGIQDWPQDQVQGAASK